MDIKDFTFYPSTSVNLPIKIRIVDIEGLDTSEMFIKSVLVMNKQRTGLSVESEFGDKVELSKFYSQVLRETVVHFEIFEFNGYQQVSVGKSSTRLFTKRGNVKVGMKKLRLWTENVEQFPGKWQISFTDRMKQKYEKGLLPKDSTDESALCKVQKPLFPLLVVDFPSFEFPIYYIEKV